MSEEFETYDNTRPQEPQNGQPAGNAYNMSQGYGYGYGNQNAGATGAYSNGYNTGANGYQDGNAANTGIPIIGMQQATIPTIPSTSEAMDKPLFCLVG